ncbi:PREDICTED: uncharacterized protein LOC109351904 [Lupinus angustifolius]|uniref:uncharacterized protein LOC109351904 n=1 Tax=Lupinus angustifolius TaxID=3871 RepID=UPI00092FB608|nr:PREDICTED: uncharacterized protein LOC109351904 [Lupinus angustifolius]XP_019449139.1 PREDICTED: uncharacterized protein LOC109351904 [Lupinus angustifolius]
MKPLKKTPSSSSRKPSDLNEKSISHTTGTFKFQPRKTNTFLDALSLNVSSSPDEVIETTGAICQPEQQSRFEKKQAAVHEEMKRMRRLPRNSTYTVHRMRVLNKTLQLMLSQRTESQENELELLLAGLSL